MSSLIRARSRAAGADEGSLMLVFLVLIVVMAMSTVTVATVVSAQKVTRHANSFQQVLPQADVGIQRALFSLNNDEASTLPVCPTATADATCLSSYSQPINGSQSAGSWYVRHPDKLEYDVTSTSTQAGVARTVTAQILDQPRFPLAAFADSSITFNGGNSADSYDHTTGSLAHTGDGDTGSNGSLVFHGNATSDGVTLYDYLTNPSGTRCTGTPCANLTTFGPKLDISSAAATAFMSTALAACQAAGTLIDWKTSVNGSLTGGTHCYNSMLFDADTTNLGTDANPTIIYVLNDIDSNNGIQVNIPASGVPDPQALRIYVLGQATFGNHTATGAAIWAPHAACGGSPSNAQADIYGALVCGSISNQGGWNFHYDDALGSIGTGQWYAQHYSEK
ncbi:MAG: hypothetical protein JWN31_982 [Frankiales bacterium]|nr:hypothetical protein [Frankiales bacterium]